MPRAAEQKPDTGSIRDHILKVAGELFYSRGIRAVGIDEIIAEADIAKATLYRHFSGKEDIIVSYLETRKARLENSLMKTLARKGATGRTKVLSVFDDLMKTLKTPGFRGCAFLMAVAEHAESARIRKTARSYKLFLRDQLRALLDGEVPESDDLADQLLLVYEGAIATAVLRPESNPGAQARRCAKALLAAQ